MPIKPLARGLAALMILLPAAGHAEDVTESAAGIIERQLDYYLPDGMVKDGLLRVHASGDHYELVVNLGALFTGIDRLVQTTEVRPLTLRLSRTADGLWSLDGRGSPKVAAQFTSSAGEKGRMILETDVDVGIVIDPLLGFPRSATITLAKLNWHAEMTSGNLSFAADKLELKTGLANLRSGIADLKAGISAGGLKLESGPKPIGLSMADFAVSWDIGAANVDGMLKVAGFLFDKQKQGLNTLTASEQQDLRNIYRAERPFAAAISQQVSVEDLRFSAARNGALAKAKLSLSLGNDSDETRISLSMREPFLPSDVLPYGAAALLPQDFNTDLVVKGFRWDEGMDYAFEHQDALTPEQNAMLRNALVPGDRVTFTFNNSFARAPQYDVAVAGWLSASAQPRNARPEADLTITARDIDKTVNFLQANANIVHPFRQAATMLLAAKGFGQQGQDKAISWHLELNKAGKLTVNGREMPH